MEKININLMERYLLRLIDSLINSLNQVSQSNEL